MSDTTTRGIRIQVSSIYVPEKSSPPEEYYFFAYQVTITNVGSETAQLLSREWIITDSNGNVERVVGPGVIGEQPVLVPGASFEYKSYCPLHTPVGSMHGAYTMVTASGERFDAIIEPFSLEQPHSVN